LSLECYEFAKKKLLAWDSFILWQDMPCVIAAENRAEVFHKNVIWPSDWVDHEVLCLLADLPLSEDEKGRTGTFPGDENPPPQKIDDENDATSIASKIDTTNRDRSIALVKSMYLPRDLLIASFEPDFEVAGAQNTPNLSIVQQHQSRAYRTSKDYK
jgi:hypothetical protein